MDSYSLLYDSMGPEAAILDSIIIFYVIFIGLLLIIGLASYILRGIAIYNMSVNRGLSLGWLGFIPLAHHYQFGRIAGEIELGKKKIRRTDLWLLLSHLLFGFICVANYVVGMVVFVRAALIDYPVEKIIGSFFIWLIVFYVIFFAGGIFISIIRYMALHKIFAQYSTGQKPIFYLLLAMFVPLACPILLVMHCKRPLLATEQANGSVEAFLMESAPMGAAPMEATPMEAAPMGAAPMEATPMEATPMEATPMEAASLGSLPEEDNYPQ